MEDVIALVLTALEEAGIPAVKAFPGGMMPRLTAPRAAVRLESVKSETPGLYEYLGVEETPDRGPVERYGRRLSAVLLIRILAPDSASVTPAVCRALQQGLGSVTVEKITASAPVFDSVADAFVTEVRGELSVYLYERLVSSDVFLVLKEVNGLFICNSIGVQHTLSEYAFGSCIVSIVSQHTFGQNIRKIPIDKI